MNSSIYSSTPLENKGAAPAEQRHADGARPSTETAKRSDRSARPKYQTAAAGQGVRKPRQKPLPRLRIGSDVEIANRLKCGLEREFGSVPYCEGEFWRYIVTHWEPIPKDETRCRVHACDGLPWGERSKRVQLCKGRIDSILHELASMLSQPTFFEVRPPGINCLSGFISFEEGTPQALRA
jgi:hypothetical protein